MVADSGGKCTTTPHPLRVWKYKVKLCFEPDGDVGIKLTRSTLRKANAAVAVKWTVLAKEKCRPNEITAEILEYAMKNASK